MEGDGTVQRFERRHKRRPVFGRAGGGGGDPLGVGRLLPQPAHQSPDTDPDRRRRGRVDHAVPAACADPQLPRAAESRLEGMAGGRDHRRRRAVPGHHPVHGVISASSDVQSLRGDVRAPADPTPDRDRARLDHPRRAQAPMVLAIALVPGLLALLLYYRALSRTPASLATIAEMAYPVAATFIASAPPPWGFNQPIYGVQLVGTALLIGVIVLLNLTKERVAEVS